MQLGVEDIQPQLTRRRPGQSALTTPRDVKDKVEIQSGIEEGYTLGTTVNLLVKNEDQRPHDYGNGTMDNFPRPSHADFRSLTSGVNSIPFALTRKPLNPTQPVTQELMDVDLAHSLRPHDRSCHTPPPTLVDQTSQSFKSDAASFEKLNHGDVGYGGNAFSGVTTSPVSPGTGILARQLRGLDVEPDEDIF